jgi:sporulation protein YlmC with PRC-barrel domain
MTVITRVHMLGTAALLVVVPFASAMAQTQAPLPSQTSPPEIVKPQATPSEQRQVMPPAKSGEVAPNSSLVGLVVMSSDGRKLGSVRNVSTGPDGKTVIFLKTGSFLGFGGHVVAIPEGKFTRSGDFIQLGMTAEDVSKLPEAKD